MFTGIVSDIGEVTAADKGRFTIRTRYPAAELEVGGSMACDGCCLTMTSLRADGARTAGESARSESSPAASMSTQ